MWLNQTVTDSAKTPFLQNKIGREVIDSISVTSYEKTPFGVFRMDVSGARAEALKPHTPYYPMRVRNAVAGGVRLRGQLVR